MGVNQSLLYPTWFGEGFFLVRDPDVAYASARAYNDWITDFCKAAPNRLFAAAILPLQNMDFALEELQRVARIPSVRAVFIRPVFVEDRYLNHPYYEPLWAELERLGMTAAVHATPGLWNPEWTSHGPFFEKIKYRLAQPAVPGGGGGPFAGGRPRATPPSSEQHRLAIRWRRSSPPGSITTCTRITIRRAPGMP